MPGIFALDSSGGTVLNVSAFAACPPGFQPPPGFDAPFVQSVRLTKTIPFQPKCPSVYPGATYTQFGRFIRSEYEKWAKVVAEPGAKGR